MESLIAREYPPAVDPAGALTANPRRRLFGFIAGGLVVTSLLMLAGYASRQLERPLPALAEEEPVYLPDVRFLRLASLGYHNALADVLWFRTIDYFGKHFRGDRLYPWLARMCDVVTDLDPRAEHVYSFAGFILTWEAQTPAQGIQLLEKGVGQFPDSWQLHYYLGFTRFYFNDDLEGALPHLKRAAELPGTHPYVSRLAAMLYAQQYGTDVAREFLEELRGSGGSAMDGVIRERLKDIEFSEQIAGLERGVQQYRERFGHDPASLREVVAAGFVAQVPAEPFGHEYIYDPATRQVRSSSGRRPLRMYDSERRKQVLGGRSYRD